MNRSQHQREGGRDAVGLEDATPESLCRQIDSMQRELDALRHDATDASELAMLGLLSACTAHELRNVLTPVLSYAQLARKRPGDREFVEKALERILGGLQAAATILGGTLDRASGGGNASRDDEADVEAALRDSLEMLPRHPSQDGVNLVVDVERGLRARIGPVALRQVLLNLLLNSMDAMRSTSTACLQRITVRARRSAGPKPIVVEVSDTGPGIPTDLVARIFEPLASTARATPDGTRRGAGLGLSICRRLIESAGGSIEHDASATHGATFRILLPSPATVLRKVG